MANVQCNECGHTADEATFPKGRDFFQRSYVASCPACHNRQSPGNASMRTMPGHQPPFSYCGDAPTACQHGMPAGLCALCASERNCQEYEALAELADCNVADIDADVTAPDPKMS